METFWYTALAFMVIMYVILDGFDLGMGIFYLKSAKNDNERRTLLNAIGPVWDGNEVWLIAAGGALFFAFPKVYASAFSGFYLPLIIVLWLLIGRALGMELRKHIDNGLWKSFWDVVFSLSSILLIIFFGAAFGNILRGVPLQSDGYFFEALWTTFTPVPDSGILDWFTVLMAIVAFLTLMSHGANYIAVKTTGELQQRARAISSNCSVPVILISITMFIAVSIVRPEMWQNYFSHLWGFVFPFTGMAGMLGMLFYRRKQNDKMAFVSSSLFIFGMMSGTAFGLYPNLLRSTNPNAESLTVHNSGAGAYGLEIGTIWWAIGIVLVISYFVYLFYTFRGKVHVGDDQEGY